MILLADLCAMFYNANRGDAKALSQADFLPFMKQPESNPQAVEQQQQMLELLQSAMGVKH